MPGTSPPSNKQTNFDSNCHNHSGEVVNTEEGLNQNGGAGYHYQINNVHPHSSTAIANAGPFHNHSSPIVETVIDSAVIATAGIPEANAGTCRIIGAAAAVVNNKTASANIPSSDSVNNCGGGDTGDHCGANSLVTVTSPVALTSSLGHCPATADAAADAQPASQPCGGAAVAGGTAVDVPPSAVDSAATSCVSTGAAAAAVSTATASTPIASSNSNKVSPRESGEDSEDESEILEESPCGRWLKRREEVEQRDVPGIDCAHLAMDTEEGVEVVWNEVQFSERKNFKSQEEKIQLVFENLTQLEHPNIVKFHRYWTDTHNDKPRVIFITEYMSSGSLKQFLKRTKRNVKRLPLQAWRRWCTQILSALSYLHSCTPPIIHGNLTCDTIFIQHNGLVKIGSVAPDAIHHHVKTCRENIKNIHFIAPEYVSAVTPAIDIFSFGMCALEMAALEIQGNGDSGTLVTDELVMRTIESLDDAQQKDFILKCLNKDPSERLSARDLLFHPLLFEVHSLKLLSAHCLVDTTPNFSETLIDETIQRLYKPDAVLADIARAADPAEIKLADVNNFAAEKLEKFVEDVRYGIYPLTAFAARQPPPQRQRAISPETTESVKSVTPEPLDVETRRVVTMLCSVKPREDSCDLMMTILLRMDDKMNRQLTCPVSQDDSATSLSEELVHLGFIHDTDREKIASLIEDTLRRCFSKQQQQQHQHQHHHQQQMLSINAGGELHHHHHHHHHHHLPMTVHTTSIERNWTVADSESPSGAAPTATMSSGNGSGGGGTGITSDGPSTPATEGMTTTVLASPASSSGGQAPSLVVSPLTLSMPETRDVEESSDMANDVVMDQAVD